MSCIDHRQGQLEGTGAGRARVLQRRPRAHVYAVWYVCGSVVGRRPSYHHSGAQWKDGVAERGIEDLSTFGIGIGGAACSVFHGGCTFCMLDESDCGLMSVCILS